MVKPPEWLRKERRCSITYKIQRKRRTVEENLQTSWGKSVLENPYMEQGRGNKTGCKLQRATKVGKNDFWASFTFYTFPYNILLYAFKPNCTFTFSYISLSFCSLLGLISCGTEILILDLVVVVVVIEALLVVLEKSAPANSPNPSSVQHPCPSFPSPSWTLSPSFQSPSALIIF